ncbi:MAG: hypothetical protein Q8L41_13185 [Anaerolineales bacterium]|nr:hypothetical protein [Anaerolineales bacterium]
MRHPFPTLRVVSTRSLLFQVQDDIQRVDAIMESLTTESDLRDTPIVATIGSGGLQYTVLDEVDCVIALRKMK